MPASCATTSPRHKPKTLADIYRPPTDMCFQGTFDQLRQAGREQGRWLLVNIQSPTEFASHQLNADTWRDETLKMLISASFLFWQQYIDRPEGEKYCRYYLANHPQLPHIGLLDPVTGQLIKSWTGFKDAVRLMDTLTEISDMPPTDGYAEEPPPSQLRAPARRLRATAEHGPRMHPDPQPPPPAPPPAAFMPSSPGEVNWAALEDDILMELAKTSAPTPKPLLKAGDEVVVNKLGDRRFEERGLVVRTSKQGAMVRFADGAEEGFKFSSVCKVASAQPLQLSPRRSRSASSVPPKRTRSAGGPVPVQRMQSAPVKASIEEELSLLDVRVRKLASRSRCQELVQAAHQPPPSTRSHPTPPTQPRSATRNTSALGRARQAAQQRRSRARGAQRLCVDVPETPGEPAIEVSSVHLDDAPAVVRPTLRAQLAQIREREDPSLVAAWLDQINGVDEDDDVPTPPQPRTPAYARRRRARARWGKLRVAQRLVAWRHGRLEAPNRCVVCLDDVWDETEVAMGALRCGDGHLICCACLPRIVVAAAARAPIDLSAEEQRSGRYCVACPLRGHGCRAGPLPLTRVAAVLARAPGGDGDAAFETLLDAQIKMSGDLARLAPRTPAPMGRPVGTATAVVAAAQSPPPRMGLPVEQPPQAALPVVVDGTPLTPQGAPAAPELVRRPSWAARTRARAVAHAEARAEARERRRELEAQRQAAEALQRREGLRAIQAALRDPTDGTYTAYQCPRCGCGPITHQACHNLRAHHRDRARTGRGRISNACPNCGWFSSRLADWPRWSGEHLGPDPARRNLARRLGLVRVRGSEYEGELAV